MLLSFKIYSPYLWLLYGAFLLATFNIGLPFEFGIVPSIIALLMLGNKYISSTRGIRMEFSLLVLMAFSIISALIYKDANNIKESLFLLMVLSGILLASKIHASIIRKIIFNIAVILLLVGLCDVLIPGFSSFKSMFLTRSFFPGVDAVRGVSSLATEPSYYALEIFSCWLIYYSSRGFRPIDLRFFLVCFLSLVLSKSTMAVFVLFVLVTSLPRKYFLSIVLIGSICLPIIWVNFFGLSRAGQLFNVLFSGGGVVAVLQDGSAGARFYFILKDLEAMNLMMFFPMGPGSYGVVTSFLDLTEIIPSKFSSVYDFTTSGSLLGRFFVEYGVVAIATALYCYYKLANKVGMVRAVLLLLTILVILFQMISLVFAPIALSIGVFIGLLMKKRIEVAYATP